MSCFLSDGIRAVRQHLGLRSRSRIAALVHDLLLLTSHIRVAFLWDYSEVRTASKDDDFVTVAGGSVDVSQVEALLSALGAAHANVRALGVVMVGPSLFVVHREMLLRKLQIPVLEDTQLVGVDRNLGIPRFCTSSECSTILDALEGASEILRQWLAPVTHSASVMLELKDDAFLVCMHGWLLEYPIIYCFLEAVCVADATAVSGSSSCLAGEPLRMFRLTARPHNESKQQRDGAPHMICSFTLPTRLLSDVADGHGGLTAVLSRWEVRMRQRVGDAAGCWFDAVLEVRDHTFDNIVL